MQTISSYMLYTRKIFAVKISRFGCRTKHEISGVHCMWKLLPTSEVFMLGDWGYNLLGSIFPTRILGTSATRKTPRPCRWTLSRKAERDASNGTIANNTQNIWRSNTQIEFLQSVQGIISESNLRPLMHLNRPNCRIHAKYWSEHQRSRVYAHRQMPSCGVHHNLANAFI